MAIKLICTDMDGTLLADDHNVPEENREALKKAVDKGIHVAITTGRLFTSAKYYARMTGVDAPIISSNGAYIRSGDSNDVIYENPLSLEETLEIYDILKKYDFRFNFNTYNSVISLKDEEDHSYKDMNKLVKACDRVEFIVNENLTEVLKENEGNILKVIAIDKENKYLKEMEKAKEEFKALGKYEVVSSWSNNFEVMKKGTSKGEAVKRLAEMLGVKREEVMCIGDSENDLSMIEYAGVSVAMGNGLDILKEKATFVTDTNTKFGVAKAIEKFI
ncbi:Cof-type HAD-IIB family hydrolase [Clostridium sp. LY3-2]|uniref:Cof-type HAD-IIB family hydrolase n=1 Tax=Clostridium sp. LY3-2 TaxID=2942482 RepID=UPI002152229B|nr:Cof-type HAD-IIB family hydrolase [Clostridium sp. LY3-2]MCR6514246.1 Cof-type HAD-IIB family hydrolase [Clostridium sp. LY3-2]